MEWVVHFLSWYVYLLIVGIVFYPVARKIFGHTRDTGYVFARACGIILLSYSTLLLGILRLVPFGRLEIIGIMGVFAFVGYRKLTVQDDVDIVTRLFRNRGVLKWIIVEEILFFSGLLLWTIVRSQEPSIHGLEKFMDFGFMQSIARSTYFPPLDMWFSADTFERVSGYFINYYYFGHLSGALLIKLTGVPASVGYNLILANIFGLAVSMSFGIVVNLIHQISDFVSDKREKINDLKIALYGILGALVLNIAGNLHTIYLFTRGYENESPVPPWTVLPDVGALFKVIQTKFPDILGALGEYSRYWYPNATRFIPNTIHEFPSYSYIVADLHGHVFDIPFVLLTIGIILFVIMPIILRRWSVQAIPSQPESHRKGDRHQSSQSNEGSSMHRYATMIRSRFGESFLANLLVKCVETHVTITLLLGFLAAVHFMTNAFDGPIYMLLSLVLLVLLQGVSVALVVHIVLLVFGFIYFSLPFSVFFEPFVSGIGVNCAFPLVQSLAKGQASVKIGPFLFEQGNCQRSEAYQLVILWGFFWFFALVLVLVIHLTRRLVSTIKHHVPPREHRLLLVDRFVLIIFVFGTVLVTIPEFFYIKDIYPTHFRANTMFKLGYQAYMMMSIMVIYVLWRVTVLPSVYGRIRKIIIVISAILITLNIVYMRFGVQSYYGDMTRPIQLDGTIWLRDQYPDLYEIVQYFNTKVPGQPVIAEAQGDSYTDYNVVSAYTGLPTIAGWWVHEWLWRGTSDVVGRRIPEIEMLYQSDDIDLTRKVIRKYTVEYIIISSNERKKYDTGVKKINEEKFRRLAEEVFRTSDGKGVVYRVK